MKTNRTQIIERGTDHTETFRECQIWLEQRAGRDELHTLAIIVAAKGSEALRFLETLGKNSITPWDVGLAVLLCLTSRANSRSSGGNLEQLADALLLRVRDLISDDWAQWRNEGERSRSRNLRLLETNVSQTSLRRAPLAEIARARVLLGLDGFRTLPSDPSGEADRLIRASYGYSAAEIFSAAVAIWTHGAAVLDVPHFVSGTIDPDKHRQLLTAFLDKHSIDLLSVPEAYERLGSKGRVESLAAEFFATYPAIKISADRYLLAPSAYFMDAVTMGFVRRACAQAENESGSAASPFRRWIGGRRFEPYVGELLREYCGSSLVHPDYEYLNRNRNKKSSDWIVVEGDDVVFIECKIRNLYPGTIFGFDWDEVTKDLDNKLAQFFQQIAKYLHNLEAADQNNELRPDHADFSRRILAAPRWHFVVVFPQMASIYQLHGGPERLRRAIDDGLAATEPAVKASWDRWKATKLASVTPLSCADLELLFSHGKGQILASTIGAYGKLLDSEPPVTEEGLADSLRNFLLRERRGVGAKAGQIPLLSEIFNRSMSQVVAEWFGSEAAQRFVDRSAQRGQGEDSP